MPLRYAILHHTGVPAPHFDLLFEPTPGAPLATWRSPTWPLTGPVTLERLPDHRPLYLDYEGPLSNDRGHVTRVAAGTFTFTTQSGTHWHLSLDSDGPLILDQSDTPALWLARPAP